MKDSINEKNLKADEKVYGRWASRSDQFSSEEPLKLLYELFCDYKKFLPQNLNVIEFGSAEGIVGEYFKKHLFDDGFSPELTLVDVVKEHLDKNTNLDTIKINDNLLDFSSEPIYHLGIARSLLHYFSEECQALVLKNIINSITDSGMFLSQNFVQIEEDMPLYKKMNTAIGKSFALTDEDTIKNQLMSAGFKEVIHLGDLPTWNYTSENLKGRYNLKEEEVRDLRNMIKDASDEEKTGFTITDTGFTLPIRYKVFLSTK